METLFKPHFHALDPGVFARKGQKIFVKLAIEVDKHEHLSSKVDCEPNSDNMVPPIGHLTDNCTVGCAMEVRIK